MNYETFIALDRTLRAAALLLGLAAIPLASRHANRPAWAAHAGAALATGLAMAAVAHVAVFFAIIPWWRTAGAYLASFTAPVLLAGWAARAAARRWQPHARWRITAAALGAFLVCAAVGIWTAAATLPMLVHAVK